MSDYQKLFLDIKDLFESQLNINRILLDRIINLENKLKDLELIINKKGSDE